MSVTEQVGCFASAIVTARYGGSQKLAEQQLPSGFTGSRKPTPLML